MGRVFVVAVGLIVALALAWLTLDRPSSAGAPAQATVQTAATRPPVAPEGPLTLQGLGSQNSERFHLRGGTYRADWSARSPFPNDGCFYAGHLLTVRNNQISDIGSALVRAGTPVQQDHTWLYGVAAGDYYLHVNAGCSWAVTLTPQ